MKRIIALLLVLMMCLTLCACGGNDETKSDLKNFPYIGTWVNEDESVFIRVKEDGVLVAESVLTNTSTKTVNGVTTSSESKSLISNTYTWSVENGSFLFNGTEPYTPTIENERYCLVGDKQTYYRVGELDYVISLTSDENAGKMDVNVDAEEYVLGAPIVVEGIEMTLEECGISDDIRVSSNSSGIKFTSGPSVEAGKQYVYLKGSLKNTGHSSARTAIAGMVYLDDYEFNLQTETICTSGAPSSSVDPMETVHILLYAQVSDEMVEMFSDGKLVFGFNDNFADVELENAQHLYYVDIKQ